MTSPPLLAVFAHPDDESLSAGGLLARHAAQGGRVEVVTATWASGTARARELAEALRTLGAGEPRLLGYADARRPESAPGAQRLCDADLDEAVGRLVVHIREVRPEVIVTHDRFGGVTGHPDHVRTHELTVLAAQAAGEIGRHIDGGPPWLPRHLYLATHPRSAMDMLTEIIGPGKARHGVPDEEVDVRLDVGPWLDVKVAAVLAHRSEVERGALPGLVATSSPTARRKLLATEWYAVQDLP